MKHTPTLAFHYDGSTDEGFRIDQVIREQGGDS